MAISTAFLPLLPRACLCSPYLLSALDLKKGRERDAAAGLESTISLLGDGLLPVAEMARPRVNSPR
jgi:hypothetical protein